MHGKNFRKKWLSGQYREIIHIKINSLVKNKQVIEVTTSWYESKLRHTYKIGNGRDGIKQAKMPYFHCGHSS